MKPLQNWINTWMTLIWLISPRVRVVHGKGTGALRNAVQSHLKRLKYVKEYRLGEYGEGDAGVTIVTFK